jgi:hypothetical protein
MNFRFMIAMTIGGVSDSHPNQKDMPCGTKSNGPETARNRAFGSWPVSTLLLVLVDRDTSLFKMRSTNDQSSNRRSKPSLMPLNAQESAISMPPALRVKNVAGSRNLITQSIKSVRTHENTVYLSLPGVYPMLTRIGLVASCSGG